jgi:hypothetical protein
LSDRMMMSASLPASRLPSSSRKGIRRTRRHHRQRPSTVMVCLGQSGGLQHRRRLPLPGRTMLYNSRIGLITIRVVTMPGDVQPRIRIQQFPPGPRNLDNAARTQVAHRNARTTSAMPISL